jgi:hypothetical protein
MSQLNCTLSDLACARNASAQDVLAASLAAYSQVPLINIGIPSGTPYRPMLGSYISQSGEKSAKTNKSIIFTSVANEAGTLTSIAFTQSVAGATDLTVASMSGVTIILGNALETAFNDGRGEALANLHTVYPTSPLVDGLRTTFETVVTDGLWRCAIQNTAQR